MLKRQKSRVHIANFEEGNRTAQLSLEFVINSEIKQPLKRRLVRGLVVAIFLPIILPLKVIWYVIRNVTND